MLDRQRKYEEWRTEAQTDADRIWYAPEFRRLEGVTQVVPPQDDYVFHDRLTHSIKVAQVAATLARKLISEAEKTALSAQLAERNMTIEEWIDPDHCYVAGLAHDIGHPPFGHAGESAIQELMKRLDVELSDRSFEGNAQSVRIVAFLSFRKPPAGGLNLTLRSLAAIAKYPWLKDEHPVSVPKLKKKWSFYPEEADVLRELKHHGFVKAETNVVNGLSVVKAVHRWPEAEIMDWADDISYAVHDLEDFYRAGHIPLHRISAALRHAPDTMYKNEARGKRDWSTTDFSFAGNDEEAKEALVFARSKMEKMVDENGDSLKASIPEAFVEIMRVLADRLPTNRFDGSRQAHTDLQNFGSEAISYFSSNCHAELTMVEGEPWLKFRVDNPTRLAAEFFKAICQFYVIESSGLATMQYGQARGLERLVDALMKMSVAWLEKHGEATSQKALPARLRAYLEDQATILGSNEIPSDEKARRELIQAEMRNIYLAVIDYTCGLRDLQATLLEERLFGHKPSLALSSSWLDV
ncbi:dGTP triphosphohydrolase [Arthrobacter sp. RAF14]|uniref:dGTP triphosphohydrolase n=1 Tax=Arthrobacter sp. RAF14 TaxID=3233051 RepID=UPI003F8DAB91